MSGRSRYLNERVAELDAKLSVLRRDSVIQNYEESIRRRRSQRDSVVPVSNVARDMQDKLMKIKRSKRSAEEPELMRMKRSKRSAEEPELMRMKRSRRSAEEPELMRMKRGKRSAEEPELMRMKRGKRSTDEVELLRMKRDDVSAMMGRTDRESFRPTRREPVAREMPRMAARRVRRPLN